MSRELRSATAEFYDGGREFYYYTERSVSQQIGIEKLWREKGETQPALLLAAFIVCALDADGKRLYRDIEFDEVANGISYDNLVRATLKIGATEPTDPKE